MDETTETLHHLGQGQRVRLRAGDGDIFEVRVNQREYSPNERLRIELTSDLDGDDGRYQVESHVGAKGWTPLSFRRFDRGNASWTSLGKVSDVTPMEMFRTMKSDDMEAQEATGRDV